MTQARAPLPDEDPSARRRRGRYSSQFRKDAKAQLIAKIRAILANRAGCGLGDDYDRLVRHLDAVHAITTRASNPDALIARVAPLFAETVERDRASYGN